ncbi:hypothetical protein [Micromonospora okii]|uniref:hypothetical protein n=1 Tax=Micromonospora okii TaxID=1182970 RepID=UPI001E2FE24D|nr:hypothetical protein [Micromonospora okii]
MTAAGTVSGMARDIDRDQIIAAYADGQEVEEIERRFGVTRAEIEQIVAGEPGPVESAPAPRRAPAAIVAATLIVVLYGLVQFVTAAAHPYYSRGFAATIAAIVTVVYGLIAVGIWRGWRAVQWIGGFGGAIAVVTGAGVNAEPDPLRLIGGAVFVALLFVPEQSRDWFTRRR